VFNLKRAGDWNGRSAQAVGAASVLRRLRAFGYYFHLGCLLAAVNVGFPLVRPDSGIAELDYPPMPPGCLQWTLARRAGGVGQAGRFFQHCSYFPPALRSARRCPWCGTGLFADCFKTIQSARDRLLPRAAEAGVPKSGGSVCCIFKGLQVDYKAELQTEHRMSTS